MNNNFIKISRKEIQKNICFENKKFPRYTSQILNLVNQNAKATRKNVVGQMSELIKQGPNEDYYKWKKWYLNKRPDSIEKATAKMIETMKEFRSAMDKIDEKMIQQWVEDLVIDKTYTGLKLQEIILKKIADLKKTSYRLAGPSEESRGIDGYIGNQPVSIKPFTYKRKKLIENIEDYIIYYRKTRYDVYIDLSNISF